MKPSMRPPYWFTILLIVLLLPLFSWPWIVGGMSSSASVDDNDVNNVLMMVFPIYAVVSCYCAYRCYMTRRPLSIILLFILVLSYISAYFLIR